MKLWQSGLSLFLVCCVIFTGCTVLTEARAGAPASKNTGVSMRILWTVSGFYVGEHASMTEDAARTFLFKPLDIDETRIIFDDQQCNDVEFTRKAVDLQIYLEDNWHIPPQKLTVGDKTATIVSTNCDIPLFREFIQLNNGNLIGRLNGAFLFFEPNIEK
jgi:hypothetical protein